MASKARTVERVPCNGRVDQAEPGLGANADLSAFDLYPSEADAIGQLGLREMWLSHPLQGRSGR